MDRIRIVGKFVSVRAYYKYTDILTKAESLDGDCFEYKYK